MKTKHTRLVALVLAVLLSTAAVAPAAMAQSDDDEDDDEDSLFDDLVGTTVAIADDPLGAASQLRAAASGLATNAAYHNPFREAGRSPEECATDIREEFNEHNETYLRYANDRIGASTARDVVAIECSAEVDGEEKTETIYLVATVNESTDDYETATVETETERSVDHTVTLSGLATEEIADDFEDFTGDYAEPNERPGPEYNAEMKAKYAGHVSGTFEWLPEEDD